VRYGPSAGRKSGSMGKRDGETERDMWKRKRKREYVERDS
jgi:hypothetical protein